VRDIEGGSDQPRSQNLNC